MKNMINWIKTIFGILFLAGFAWFMWTFKWCVLSAILLFVIGAVFFEKVSGKKLKFLD